MPESGGEYTYLLHGIHTVVSFLYCYMSAIIFKPAPLAILAKVRAKKENPPQTVLGDPSGSGPGLD